MTGWNTVRAGAPERPGLWLVFLTRTGVDGFGRSTGDGLLEAKSWTLGQHWDNTHRNYAGRLLVKLQSWMICGTAVGIRNAMFILNNRVGSTSVERGVMAVTASRQGAEVTSLLEMSLHAEFVQAYAMLDLSERTRSPHPVSVLVATRVGSRLRVLSCTRS
jgi:hypothetical protein